MRNSSDDQKDLRQCELLQKCEALAAYIKKVPLQQVPDLRRQLITHYRDLLLGNSLDFMIKHNGLLLFTSVYISFSASHPASVGRVSRPYR